MQQMTDTLKAAIRSTYQVPIAKMEVYNADGSLAGELTEIMSCEIDVASSRKVLRTFSATVENGEGELSPDPFLYQENFLWYNKTVKIFYGYHTSAGDEWLSQGIFTLDSIKPDVTPEGYVLEISGQDAITKIIEDKFDDAFLLNQYILGDSVLDYGWSQSWDPDAQAYTFDLSFYNQDINVIYLYWGNDALDIKNYVRYKIQYSADKETWYTFTDLNGIDETVAVYGDVEHCVNYSNERGMQYIRITILEAGGDIILRDMKPLYINTYKSADQHLREIADTAGITNFEMPITRKYIPRKTVSPGEEKYTTMTRITSSIGWKDPYMDEHGVLRTEPENFRSVLPAWHFNVDTDNIFSFSPRFTNDVYNVIVAIYKSGGEKGIVGRAIDDDPNSPTSVQQIGRRVMTYENEMINTQEKADQFAARKLYERSQWKHQTNIPVSGHPAIQVDDMVDVTVPEAKINNLRYKVTGFKTSFDADSVQFDTRINISEQ
jgi:hypothetical protein